MGKQTELAASPTTTSQRLLVLDALRGFALLGIMLVNYTWFTGFAVIFHTAPELIEARGTLGIDTVVNQSVTLLVDSKFWSVFALLFGAGIGIQWMKAPSCPTANRRLARRLTVLLLIGLAHGTLIWFGDIISLYAVTGFALLLFSRAKTRALATCGVFFLALPIVQSVIWVAIYQQFRHAGNPAPDLGHGPTEMLSYFSTGGLQEVWQANWAFFVQRWIRAICEGRLYKLLGMFLLGVWFSRMRVFEKPDHNQQLLWRLMMAGVVVGIPTNVLYALSGGGIILPMVASEVWRTVNQCVGIPVLALAYVSGFVLAYSRYPTLRCWRVLADVGRLSLTNYVAQSLIGVFVFYGFALAKWGKIGISESLMVIAVIFAMQCLFSRWWLAHYRLGPLEWCSRCLVYSSVLPWRRHIPGSVAAYQE